VTDIAITELLTNLGLTGEVATRARGILEDAGVTNARKQRISLAKAELVEATLDERLQRVCHACRKRAVADGREVVQVQPAVCPVCRGSANGRAVREMVEACRRSGVLRLVVVGGSPTTRREFDELVNGALELRLVDGTASTNGRAAQRDIAWADLVVVLGGTQLAHKVSTLYTDTGDPVARRKLVTTSRRGIEAIADDITRSDVVSRRRP
jgi:hypothetical protein